MEFEIQMIWMGAWNRKTKAEYASKIGQIQSDWGPLHPIFDGLMVACYLPPPTMSMKPGVCCQWTQSIPRLKTFPRIFVCIIVLFTHPLYVICYNYRYHRKLFECIF